MQQVRLRAAPGSQHCTTTHAVAATYHTRAALNRAFLQLDQYQFEIPAKASKFKEKRRGRETGLGGRISCHARWRVDRRCPHWDRDFAAQSLRLEDEPRFASELGCDASFD